MATVQEIAFNAAAEGVANQRSRLESLRTRAATLLSAAAIVASFLGAQALGDTRIVLGSATPIADNSLGVLEIVAIAAFVGVALLTIYVLRPIELTTRLNGTKLVASWVDKDGTTAEQMHRELAIWLTRHYDKNEQALKPRIDAFRSASALLVVEVVAWLIDLS